MKKRKKRKKITKDFVIKVDGRSYRVTKKEYNKVMKIRKNIKNKIKNIIKK